ncbi:hypothetical protein PHYSODRAFT_503945, partial [Phytophthora sojae]
QSFQQSPRIVALVCESIRSSELSESDDVNMTDASGLFDGPAYSGLDLALDWRDLFLLLHSLQASKPILHHRTSSSRVATEASVFTDIEQLAWRIVQRSRTVAKTIEKHILDQVELLINFGGKQIHAREWKALLLMDISFFWIEQGDTGEHSPSKSATALLCLFERCQKPSQSKIAAETLSQLFISQSGKLFPHLNAIQDWLRYLRTAIHDFFVVSKSDTFSDATYSMQFQRSFDSARDYFLIASRLATVYKGAFSKLDCLKLN